MKFLPVRIGSILLGIGGAFLLHFLCHTFLNDFIVRLVFLSMQYVTLAVSLNLINGITGQFSIGHAAFYQVGAYTAAYLSAHFFRDQSLGPVAWVIVMMFLGALIASIAGLIVALPSLRLRGDYLAVVTLGFGEILRIITQNTKELGEAKGIEVAPKLSLPVWLSALLAFGCIGICRNLLQSAKGLSYFAVRDDEIASSAMGVRVTAIKVSAFIIGSAMAGAAGALLAHNEGGLTPAMFTMETSFIVLTMVVLGGTGSITGSVVAAVLLTVLPEALRILGEISKGTIAGVAVGTILLVVLIRRGTEQAHTVGKGHGWKALGTSLVVATVLSFLLNLIPIMSSDPIDGTRLRLVIFAATLICLMLARPQGMFGTKEIGLKYFRKDEVAA